jgi:hypothetical protein
MKKSSILIAVLAVMSAASTASAVGLQINFDGKSTAAMTFKEAVKLVQEKSGLICQQVCSRDEKGTVTCWEECTQAGKSEASDLPAVPVPTPVKSDLRDAIGEADEVNHSIGTAIKDCEKKGYGTLKTQFEKLLTQGLPQEKLDFVYNTKKTYKIPSRAIFGAETADAAQSMANASKSSGACVASHTEQICIDRNVCHTVCTAGQLVCYAVPGGAPYCGPGAAVCNLVCAIVPECTNSTVCDNWQPYPNTQNGDSIDDNGNVISHRQPQTKAE